MIKSALESYCEDGFITAACLTTYSPCNSTDISISTDHGEKNRHRDISVKQLLYVIAEI